jgi:hypothetical protein
MATGARGYVVRNADSDDPGAEEIHPYTLRGLRDALLDAEIKSNFGPPTAVVRVLDGDSTVISRFEDGRRLPVTEHPG